MKDKGFFDITNAKRALDIAMLVCIAVFAFYINRDIEIKGLYMDDLYMWSFYGEQNFFEFVFPIGGSVSFRPIYWMLASDHSVASYVCFVLCDFTYTTIANWTLFMDGFE